MIGQIVALVILVLLSGVFSSTEIAMFSMSNLRVRYLVEQEVRGANLLQKLKSDSHKLLITILIGNNIVNIASAAIATALAINLFANAGVGIATGVMTLIILIAGEIVPKAFAIIHAQRIAIIMSPVLSFLMKLFYPFVWLFDKLTTAIVPKNVSAMPTLTEEEVKNILELSGEQGSIKEQEREMIQNIFKLDDTPVEKIMTPRPDVLAFKGDLTAEQAALAIKDSGYSRIPVYDEDMDHITGLLYAKDLLTADSNMHVRELRRETFFVPETKRVDQLLREFKAKKMHMAIIVNEHGTMVGIVTIEDLLEEIVGEIYDETDTEEEQESDIKQLNGEEWLIKGWTEIGDVEKALGVEISDDDHATISGFIMQKLNRVPREEERFKFRDYRFIVKKVENHRVELVLVKKIKTSQLFN